jgi:hypothetical protein
MLTQMWSLAYRLSIRLGETASIAQSRKVIYFSDSYAVITASEILSIMIVNFSWSVGRRYSISPRQVPRTDFSQPNFASREVPVTSSCVKGHLSPVSLQTC